MTGVSARHPGVPKHIHMESPPHMADKFI